MKKLFIIINSNNVINEKIELIIIALTHIGRFDSLHTVHSNRESNYHMQTNISADMRSFNLNYNDM